MSTKRRSQVSIRIETANAAFEAPDRGAEIARILRKLADEYESVGRAQFAGLYDSNGNRVGDVVDSEVTR